MSKDVWFNLNSGFEGRDRDEDTENRRLDWIWKVQTTLFCVEGQKQAIDWYLAWYF